MNTIGWIGTGVMGISMCGHLRRAGHEIVVHSRTRSRAEPLLQAGARWAETPADVARDAHIIFTMVGFPADVRAVYFGEHGLLPVARSGQIFVDMTTTEPSLARDIAATATARGASALDAPVSGGDVGAREARLAIMVGGDPAVFAQVLPLFQRLGQNIVHQGPAGSGQHAKMCNQLVIAGTMIGVCESMLYAQRAGLDGPTMLQSIRSGAAGCWTLENLAPRLLRHDYAPGFFVDHFVKDLGIALAEAERMQLALPGLALARQLYIAVQAQGHGRCGTQALLLALAQLSARNPQDRTRNEN
ncbi:MAG: 2-hydroxy-3-oxopropionate reductase [Phycisphaerae bacterium]|nr:2-hydroxy-3-oxopropionate reductase [Phycisphaerae bacterium]